MRVDKNAAPNDAAKTVSQEAPAAPPKVSWAADDSVDTYADNSPSKPKKAQTAQGVQLTTPDTIHQRTYKAVGSGYYPDSSALEGGYVDRKGKPLRTLQDFLNGKAPYVSVAMDSEAFRYGTKMRIPELEAKYGRAIEFRVVDTGDAFIGKGTSRVDICTASKKDSEDDTINGPLTLIVDAK